MKVGYIAPASISVINGGIRTQVNMTIEHIKKFGVEPIKISPWDYKIDVADLDIIHVFGATAENSGILPSIKNSGVPIALSPVFYSNRSAYLIKMSTQIERLLSVIGSGIRSDFTIKKEQCEMSDCILANTDQEAKLIENGFGISPNKLIVVPNGVEKRFSLADKSMFVEKYGIENFVLFAGQVNAERKNVISLLKAASKLKSNIVIIGSFGRSGYSLKCLELANSFENVLLINSLDHNSELLESAYAAAKVFVLPSYYETPGISALEAGLAGTNIAITEIGGTKEYFGKHAYYLEPKSVNSIIDSVNKALSADIDTDLKDHILKNYTWEAVAERTFDQYQRILK